MAPVETVSAEGAILPTRGILFVSILAFAVVIFVPTGIGLGFQGAKIEALEKAGAKQALEIEKLQTDVAALMHDAKQKRAESTLRSPVKPVEEKP